jgi:putative transposase
LAVASLRQQYGISERHACRLLGHWRGTQRYWPTVRTDEDALTRAMISLASEYGRYGYRRITALLRGAGWRVGKDRVECIWRREGLKMPARQKPRGRLWLNDGSCVRLRPERPNHVWSYDFVSALTHDGRTLRMLTLIDEYTRESLAIRVDRRLNSHDVIDTLAEVMLARGVPEHVRSDNGPEFIAKALRRWLAGLGTKPLYIEPGSPWENGNCESFNSKLRDELLNGEIFYSLKEAQIAIERGRVHYNTRRPRSALGYRPPAPTAVESREPASLADVVTQTNNSADTKDRAGQLGKRCHPKGNPSAICSNATKVIRFKRVITIFHLRSHKLYSRDRGLFQ